MKRVVAILLIVLYASLNSVDVIGMHFCHGKLVDISLNETLESCCDNEAAFSAPCCDEVTIDVELEEDQLANQVLNPEPIKSLDLFAALQFMATEEIANTSLTYEFVDSSPPGDIRSDLYLVNQSLVLYN